ncbi:MAG: peptidoglycan-binding protein, partial [Planctomycetales bacterium]|nr:peptidoglycan-binding protein [Planctomycetales bacterium]
QDETWVLWDRQLIDDELYSLWSQFAAGVRIFVLSDSCHSGTVTRVLLAKDMFQVATKSRAEPKFRVVTREDRSRYFDNDPKIRAAGETAQWCAGPSERAIVQATVLLISGCQDDQLSADGTANGLFTEKVKQVWNNGGFAGDYRKFWTDIRAQMPPQQLPNYFVIGAANPSFELQKPFTIGSSSAVTPAGSVHPTIRRGDRNAHVTELQQRLVAHGYPVTIDGIFGGGTEAQVMAFQRDNGLMADGIVGANTWAALDAAPSGSSSPAASGGSSGPSSTASNHPTLRLGSQGPAVKHLQQLLIGDGATLMADGFFGNKTASAVRAFQASHGLAADAVVGPETWAALEPPGMCTKSVDELVTA